MAGDRSLGCPHIPRLGVVACLVVLALAGCGRKGPLEPPLHTAQAPPPPAANTPAEQEAQAAQTRALSNEEDPGLIQSPNIVYEQSAIAKLNSSSKNPARPINAPPVDRPNTFFLDPLVK